MLIKNKQKNATEIMYRLQRPNSFMMWPFIGRRFQLLL